MGCNHLSESEVKQLVVKVKIMLLENPPVFDGSVQANNIFSMHL
jgi:hypothetical protein